MPVWLVPILRPLVKRILSPLLKRVLKPAFTYVARRVLKPALRWLSRKALRFVTRGLKSAVRVVLSPLKLGASGLKLFRLFSKGKGVVSERAVSPKGEYPIDFLGSSSKGISGVELFQEIDEPSLRLYSEFLLGVSNLPHEEVVNVRRSSEKGEGENRDKPFWLLLPMFAAIGVVFYKVGGRWTFSIKDVPEVENIPPSVKGVAYSAEQVPGIVYEEGTIYERLGVQGYRISSQYGEERGSSVHRAIDIAAPQGTAVRAPFNGFIQFIAYGVKKAGNLVEFVSEDGKYAFRFLHLSSIPVKVGQRVTKGEVIAFTGNTYGGAKRANGQDWGSGAHLHLEAYRVTGKLPKVGKQLYRSPNVKNINPESIGISQMGVQVSQEGSPTLEVKLNQSFQVGVQGKNLWSIKGGDSPSDPWVGRVGSVGSGFVAFGSYENAARAADRVLLAYQTRHDVSGSGGEYVTIGDIASNPKHSYLDSRVDDVSRWVKTVSKVSGFRPEERIDLRDSRQAARLLRGIAFQEHSAEVSVESLEEVITHYRVFRNIPSNEQ